MSISKSVMRARNRLRLAKQEESPQHMTSDELMRQELPPLRKPSSGGQKIPDFTKGFPTPGETIVRRLSRIHRDTRTAVR